MSAIFLSASVPQAGRGDFYKTADPFLIQCAVRELLIAVLGRRLLVWGGHPAITPMVWAACEDLGVAYSQAVVLYQSRFFQDYFPEENARFKNVVYVDAVAGDRASSLAEMRKVMFSRTDLRAAVFIGGMEGVLDEYNLITERRSDMSILAVAGPGGAARDLAVQRLEWSVGDREDLNFARMFHEKLQIAPDERRQSILKL